MSEDVLEVFCAMLCDKCAQSYEQFSVYFLLVLVSFVVIASRCSQLPPKTSVLK